MRAIAIKAEIVSGQPDKILDQMEKISKYRRDKLSLIPVKSKKYVPNIYGRATGGSPEEQGLCPKEERGDKKAIKEEVLGRLRSLAAEAGWINRHAKTREAVSCEHDTMRDLPGRVSGFPVQWHDRDLPPRLFPAEMRKLRPKFLHAPGRGKGMFAESSIDVFGPRSSDRKHGSVHRFERDSPGGRVGAFQKRPCIEKLTVEGRKVLDGVKGREGQKFHNIDPQEMV